MSLIFTDRSRYKAFFSCPFEGFLNYHFQDSGITKAGTTIPLATGTYAHQAIEAILKLVMETNDLPRSEDVRYIIGDITNAYQLSVADAGFADSGDTDRAAFIVAEQTTLLSGLVWAWSSHILPYFLEEFEVLHVEQEMERVLGCTCGLSGVGAVKNHAIRNCNGIVVMTRPDIVARKLSTAATLAYIELKTGARIDSGTFEGDVQFAFGAAGIEGFTGEELSESYVHALVKGYRKNDYNTETKKYDLPPRQFSSLCYAYVSGGISALVPQDIKFKRGKGVTRNHKKTPVWEIAFKDLPEGIPPIEHYISLMSDEELDSHVDVLGPYPYPKQQVEETLLDIEHLERRNQEVFDYVNSRISDDGFGDDTVQSEIHEYIPKSWNCYRYNSICKFYPICMKQAGWDDPCGRMNYIPRTPNHPIEFEDFTGAEGNSKL